MTDNNNNTPSKPTLRPAPTRETIQRGYQPSGSGVTGGHQPTTGQGAPTNPPSRGSGGKK